MLDVEGYHYVFVELDRLPYVFIQPTVENGQIIVDADITEAADE